MDEVDRPVAVAKAELFRALSHPARVQVLEALAADGEFPVGELADRLGMEMSHLSQQLAVLRRAGVVCNRRVGSVVFYRLSDPRLTQLLFVAREVLLTSWQEKQVLLQRMDGSPSRIDDSARSEVRPVETRTRARCAVPDPSTGTATPSTGGGLAEAESQAVPLGA